MNRKIVVCLLCFVLFGSSVFAEDQSEKDTRSFWDKCVDAMLYPLEKLDDMLYHTPDRYADDVFSDDPQRSLDATDRYVEEWQEIPQDAGWLAEEGVEELSGPAGVLKDAKDFYDRWGDKYQDKPGLPRREKQKKRGLDVDFISNIYKEMDQERARKRKRQLEEAQAISAEIDEDLAAAAAPSETPAAPVQKKPKHPCQISKNHPECQKLIRRAIKKGMDKALGKSKLLK